MESDILLHNLSLWIDTKCVLIDILENTSPNTLIYDFIFTELNNTDYFIKKIKMQIGFALDREYEQKRVDDAFDEFLYDQFIQEDEQMDWYDHIASSSDLMYDVIMPSSDMYADMVGN